MKSYARVHDDLVEKMEEYRKNKFTVKPSKVEFLNWIISQGFEYLKECQEENEGGE